jgi:hypothetical protein
MATPIKPTPILIGKDAIRFLKAMEENQNKKAPKEELERIKKTYEKFQSIFNRKK